MHHRVGERGPSGMEILHRGTTLPRSERLARRIFAARARGGHGEVCERDVCEIEAGPTRASCVGAEVSTMISGRTGAICLARVNKKPMPEMTMACLTLGT